MDMLSATRDETRGSSGDGGPLRIYREAAMLTVQQMLDIACGYVTRMADAMVAACLAWSLETGDPLEYPCRGSRSASREVRPTEDVGWERMVRGNADTRWLHQ